MINKDKDKEFIYYFKKYLLCKHFKPRYMCLISFPLIGKETRKCTWDNDRKLFEFRVLLKRLLEIRNFDYFWVEVDAEVEDDMCIVIITDWSYNDYFLRKVWYDKYEGDDEKEIKAYLRVIMLKLDVKSPNYEKHINYLFDEQKYNCSGISLKLFCAFREHLNLNLI